MTVTYPSSLKIHLPHEKTKDVDKIKVDKEDRMQSSKSFGYRKYRNIKRQRMKITKRKMYLSKYIVNSKENY